MSVVSAKNAPVAKRPELVRFIVFISLLALALAAIIYRLTQVQILSGEDFAAAARANQVELIPVAAPRGLIVDRHGTVMVRSRPSFVCALIPSEIKDIHATIRGLAKILGIRGSRWDCRCGSA